MTRMSEYQLANGFYYGVNHGERGRKRIPQNEIPLQFIPKHHDKSKLPDYAPNDLSFYPNIPMPTSYVHGSKEDFFGGFMWLSNAMSKCRTKRSKSLPE